MATLHDLEVDDYLGQCVELYPETINEEFVRLPADLAYWTHKYSEALRAHLKAKLDSEKTRSRLRMEHRTLLEGVKDAATGKPAKATESMVDAAVDTDPAWEAARLAEIDAEVERVRLQGVCRALETKGHMVTALGNQILAEKRSDPALRSMARDATENLNRGG